MSGTRGIKRSMRKAKPNTYVPKIKIVGNRTDASKFVNPYDGIAAIGTDDGVVVFDTEFTGEQVGEYFAISGMKPQC